MLCDGAGLDRHCKELERRLALALEGDKGSSDKAALCPLPCGDPVSWRAAVGRGGSRPVETIRLVRGEGRGVSDWYGVRDAACPLSTRADTGCGGVQRMALPARAACLRSLMQSSTARLQENLPQPDTRCDRPTALDPVAREVTAPPSTQMFLIVLSVPEPRAAARACKRTRSN